ncbi:hypothetical protein G6F50_017099 [Rhizopus delemar]|uniref:Uncharacterized protein n=1 Tax=Rhizopus delemar TaxID=936053 RepID=A0A9P6XRJ4_9FUNG|nr:hypothetical protein G6F50_017099 [Rhizopus delemar]
MHLRQGLNHCLVARVGGLDVDGDFFRPFDLSVPLVDGQARRAKVHACRQPVFHQHVRDALRKQHVRRIADDQHDVVIAQHGASSGYPCEM